MSLLGASQPQQSAQTAPSSEGASSEQPGVTQPSTGGEQLTQAKPGSTSIGANGGPDWRAMIAGEDVEAIKDLSRFQKPEDLLKAFREQRATLSKRAEPVKLPENPTPEQIAAYRKAQGIPDIPADAAIEKIVEAYGVKPPEGYEVPEIQKGLIGEFVKEMYGDHAPPGMVKKATDFFFRHQAALEQDIRRDRVQKSKEWNNQLRDSLGSKEYETQQAAGEAWLKTEFKGREDDMANLLNAQLPGGGVLGDHPWFFELIAKQAMGSGMTDRIETNTLEANGRTLAEQQAEIEGLRRTNRAKYDSPEVQQKLDRIISLRHSRGEIDDFGNPVARR